MSSHAVPKASHTHTCPPRCQWCGARRPRTRRSRVVGQACARCAHGRRQRPTPASCARGAGSGEAAALAGTVAPLCQRSAKLAHDLQRLYGLHGHISARSIVAAPLRAPASNQSHPAPAPARLRPHSWSWCAAAEGQGCDSGNTARPYAQTQRAAGTSAQGARPRDTVLSVPARPSPALRLTQAACPSSRRRR